MKTTLVFVLIYLLKTAHSLPVVDPGLFVISGVNTCGNGTGYCLLGADCRLNQDFSSDPDGHCSGLKGAFTPSAHFVCCAAAPNLQVSLTTTTLQSDNDSITSTTFAPTTTMITTETETGHQTITSAPDYNPNDSDNDSITSTTFAPTTTMITTETETTGHQTITSPPDYNPNDADPYGDESENSIDWEGVKNTTEASDECPHCSPQAVFTLQGSPLCLGTHLKDGWVLTSGSCALRVFRAGMVKVVGKYQQAPELEASVRTISVHEDYRPYSSNILHPEPNNIGLILLSAQPKQACVPCLPGKEDKFAGRLCGTVANSTVLASKITKNDAVVTDDICESVVETLQGEGTEDFYTVACDTNSDSRYSGQDSAESGKGLLCRGYVAGIETGSGTGLAVFTRVSLYGDWIAENMVQSQRQEFDTS